MNSNKLKIIACLTMLIDHIGYLIFPQIMILRYIGRVSMPIFAFFIAEGCRYTSSKVKYFLKIFLLGIACQAVYLIQQLSAESLNSIYLNILITFSFSIIICFSYIKFEEAFYSLSRHNIILYGIVFIFTIIFACLFCSFSSLIFKITIAVDYDIAGVLLPVFAVIFTQKKKQLTLFSLGLIAFIFYTYQNIPYIWFSIITIPIISLYNGLYGNKRIKNLFYLFYPAHLAVLYSFKILFC